MWPTSRQRPLFMEKMKESIDAERLQQNSSASRRSTITRTLAIVVMTCIALLALVFSTGVGIGLARSLHPASEPSLLLGAPQTEFMIPSTEVRRHIVARAVGWTWWNGAQFGTWIGLGTAAFGAASQMNSPGAYAAGVGGTLCYLIAIAGGAAVNQKARTLDGHGSFHIKDDHGGRVTLGYQPVNLTLGGTHHNWTLPADLAWHLVMDNHTVDTFIAHDGIGHHGLVSLNTGSGGKPKPKRNEGSSSYHIDGGGSDYVYTYLESGNSAREYYFDHSYSDWVLYIPGLQYWLIDGEGTNVYQQFCMVPQDSQGNAVAAISVQTNYNNYNSAVICALEAEDANGSFSPN